MEAVNFHLMIHLSAPQKHIASLSSAAIKDIWNSKDCILLLMFHSDKKVEATCWPQQIFDWSFKNLS